MFPSAVYHTHCISHSRRDSRARALLRMSRPRERRRQYIRACAILKQALRVKMKRIQTKESELRTLFLMNVAIINKVADGLLVPK